MISNLITMEDTSSISWSPNRWLKFVTNEETKPFSQEGIWYTYHPELLSKDIFTPLYEEIKDKVNSYIIKVRGDSYFAKRLSCIVASLAKDSHHFSTNTPKESVNEYDLPVYAWQDMPILSKISSFLSTHFKLKPFDYCLVHLYRSGKDAIAWHNDKEALNTSVVSVSFGASRLFRFRKIDQTVGWQDEFTLCSGDVVHMLPGCQKLFKHTVPAQKSVKEPRINLTFRYEDDKFTI